MTRGIRRLATMVAVGVAVGLSGVSDARASDIDCKSPGSGSPVRCEDPSGAGMRCTLETDAPSPRAPRHHLVCDSTRLSERYERIYAEQQRMLRRGAIRDADITAWRARRDACDSVRCREGMFAKFWRERDTMRSADARPASPAQAATAMSRPATHEPAPTPTPTPTPMPMPMPVAREQPTSAAPHGMHAMQARPESTEFTLLSTTHVEAPATSVAAARPTAKGVHNSPEESRPAELVMESLFSGLAVLGVGAGFLWSNRNAFRRNTGAQDRRRPTVPPAMVIAYLLLLVNALLLPFTLGLK